VVENEKDVGRECVVMVMVKKAGAGAQYIFSMRLKAETRLRSIKFCRYYEQRGK
jgi:hypothetical protein